MTTDDRNAAAWARCFEVLDAALAEARPETRVYVLIGAQGAGKSTWARRRQTDEPDAILFDAILVKRSERSPILARTKARGLSAIAVQFATPLALCLARNAARPPDEVADEQGLRNVFAAIEPPTLAEGFSEIIEVMTDREV